MAFLTIEQRDGKRAGKGGKPRVRKPRKKKESAENE
jgi:hypothetical protein